MSAEQRAYPKNFTIHIFFKPVHSKLILFHTKLVCLCLLSAGVTWTCSRVMWRPCWPRISSPSSSSWTEATSTAEPSGTCSTISSEISHFIISDQVGMAWRLAYPTRMQWVMGTRHGRVIP